MKERAKGRKMKLKSQSSKFEVRIKLRIIQVSNDAKKIDKEPLLIWKKDRRPALAFFHDKENLFSKSEYKMNYREWTVININELMLLPDEYFFL
jgi:hypothetical protein